MISLQLQRHGETAHMTGMLSWMAVYFLERTSQGGAVVELLFV